MDFCVFLNHFLLSLLVIHWAHDVCVCMLYVFDTCFDTNLMLTLLSPVDNQHMLHYIRDKTAVPYFSNLVWFIGSHVIELDKCVQTDEE